MLKRAADQVEKVRRQIDEPKAAKTSNNQILQLLYEGHVKVATELYMPTDDITVMASVNAQQGYSLPSNYIAVTDVIFQFDGEHQGLTALDRKQILEYFPQSGDPTNYAIDEARNQLLLYPTPAGSAVTTTTTLSTALTDLTITVGTTVGFGGLGWILIDNEIIQYTASTANQFTGCVRGACNTTIATHLQGATVTWGDIFFAYTRLPKYNLDLIVNNSCYVANGSPTITATLSNWLSGQNIYPGDYIGIGQMSTITNNENYPLKWYQIASIPNTTTLVLTSNYSEITQGPVNAIISSASELYEQDCPMLIQWAIYQIEEGPFGNSEKAQAAIQAFNSQLLQAKKRRNGPDKLNVMKNNRFSQTSTGLGEIRPPQHFESF